MPHPMTRLCVRVGGERVQLSFFFSMPRVVNNITRTEAIQLDLGIGDAFV